MLQADICGIGHLYWDIASTLRDLMKQHVNSIQQACIVKDVGAGLEAAAHSGGFASLLISTYFAPTRSFSLCNTGHPFPMVYRAKEARWSPLRQSPTLTIPHGVPDGVVHPNEYQQVNTRLDVGDMVLTYSNVLTECRDSVGQIIGQQGVLQRLERMDASAPGQLAEKLLAGLRDEHAENDAADGATIILCQATKTKVGWRDNLLAPFRLLRSVSDHTSIK
jgi:serine phosphatase RsbU (regulator of sigma subunit)